MCVCVWRRMIHVLVNGTRRLVNGNSELIQIGQTRSAVPVRVEWGKNENNFIISSIQFNSAIIQQLEICINTTD